MSDALRTFIATRREQIFQQMEVLRRELSELEKAESAIGPTAAQAFAKPAFEAGPMMTGLLLPENEADAFHLAQQEHQESRKRFPGGIKGLVMDALISKDGTNGATAQQLIRMMKDKTGEEIARTSLSPQLSRLKDSGWLVVENGVWKATPEGIYGHLMG